MADQRPEGSDTVVVRHPRMERFAGRYLLLRKLGQGGMGEVYLARDLSTGAECALKRMRRAANDPGGTLLREFEALTRLRHPTVVSVHEFANTPDGVPYLVMEYVPGLPADQVLARGDWPALYALAARIADGLEALHAAGVVHGDLKPSNILVVPGTPEKNLPLDVRLVDFGLAALRERNDPGYRGTPGFAAPEVVRGAAPTPAADLYGLGANLFALITGRPPLDSEDRTRGSETTAAGHPRAHALEMVGTPWPLIEVILRLLHPEPAERPRDAGEVRRAIERIHPPVCRPLAERLHAATLVGRERELARLELWLSQTPMRSRMMFVSGEAGSGTSALLLELAARATLTGRPVARLSCASQDGPGGVARSLLRMLFARAETRLDASEYAPVLDSGARWNEGDLGRWVEAAAHAAAQAPAGTPMLLLLDDADRLDPWSAAWLRRLALHDPPLPLAWVIAQPDPRSHEELRVLIESDVAHHLELAPLSEAGVRHLAATRLGGEPPPTLVRYLWRHAGGHPAFTIALLRTLVERGVIVESDHGLIVHADLLAGQPPPADFERARLERLATIAPPELAIVTALAVCGPALTPTELGHLVPGANDTATDGLVAAGFALRDGDGRILLHPPSLAARIAAEIPDAERAALHRAALGLASRTPRQRFFHHRALGEIDLALAEAEAMFASHPEADLAALAAETAETHDDRAAAAEWHARAAEQLRTRGRYAAAIPHLECALQQEAVASRRGELWVLLSTATLRAGQVGALHRVVGDAFAELLEDGARARLLGNRAAAHSMQGNGAAAGADARAGLMLAEAADDAFAIGMIADVEVRLAVVSGRPEDAERWAERSADAYRRAEHLPGIIRAIGIRATLARARGALEEAEQWCSEGVEAARRCENRLPLTEQLMNQGAVQVEAGHWARAHAACSEASRLAIEDGRSIEAAMATAHLAQIEGLLGETRAARRDAERAVRLITRHQSALASYAWRSLAQAERSAGRLARASSAARRALSLAPEGTTPEARWCRIEYGRALATREHWNKAALVWNAGLAQAGDSEGPEIALLRVLAGRAALRDSDLDSAGRHQSKVATWLARHHVPLVAAHARLLDAELGFRRGRIREGLDAARAALAAFGDLPAPAEHARATLDIARLAPATSDTRETIIAWLDDAARIFERLGDRHGRERALSLAVEWLRRPGARVTVSRDHGLIERVCWLLNSLTDVDELMRRAMRAAVEQLDAERGVLLLSDPETGQFAPVAEFGAVESETRREAAGYSRRVVRHVTEGGDSLLILDAGHDPRAASESVTDMRLRSILCVPLFRGGVPVGAVYLDDSRRTHAFAEADRGMIEGFAHLMAVAIEKSRRHEEVRRANERLEGENLSLRREAATRIRRQGVIGSSAPMQRVLAMAERAARTNTTVLLTGENGTGKELIARTLHGSGKRATGPFVAVNCGAIPESLLESELFGILANTATGVRARPGKFVLADGGTLLLDEVGEMPPKQQVALLSAIASREVTPLGGSKPIPFDARIITATNSDLRRLVEQGQFREDLYYRLNVIEIEIPPLRERKADIPALARFFLKQFARQQEREVPELSPDFFAVLLRSDWPGNVRELQNYIERILAMTPGPYLRPDPPPRDLEMSPRRSRLVSQRRLPDAVSEIERRMVVEALERAGGNQSRAARELGLTEQSFRYRLRKYGIPDSPKSANAPISANWRD